MLALRPQDRPHGSRCLASIALYAINAYYPCSECMPAHRAWCALVDVDPLDETPRPERCSKCTPLIPSDLKDPKKPERGRVSEWLNPPMPKRAFALPMVARFAHIPDAKRARKVASPAKLRLFADECSDISKTDRETWAGNLVGGGKIHGLWKPALSSRLVCGSVSRWHEKKPRAGRSVSKKLALFAKLPRNDSMVGRGCHGKR